MTLFRGTKRLSSSSLNNNDIIVNNNNTIVKNIECVNFTKYSIQKPIQLGLCCLNTTLRSLKPSVFASRKMIMRTVKRDGIEALKKLILLNLEDILTMMKWNDVNGIRVFRLSSEMFPHKSNPNIENYNYDFCKPLLLKIGLLSKQLQQRLTYHPGQFNVVGSPNDEAFLHTLEDLTYHADVLDLMNLDKHSVIVVHAGGYYNNKEKTMDRWCANFKRLPKKVRKRLVIENCEKSFSVLDCLIISSRINIPVVFDTHHFNCYKDLHPEEIFQPPEYYIPLVLDTWTRRGIKPKFHVSEQGSGKRGHHSDFIDTIPNYLLEIPDKYNINIDIMIEAKKKELAIFKLYQKYPQLNTLNNNS